MSAADWINLSAQSDTELIQTDVCIVGAGAAGLYFSAELSRSNVDSVVVEAGPSPAMAGIEVGFEPVFGGDPYPGATVGRFFGMGGSTSRWGGALVPHTARDLRDEKPHQQAWRTIIGRVKRNSSSVLARLGYRKDPNFSGYTNALLPGAVAVLAEAGIDVQANLILPFRRKNLLSLWNSLSRFAAPRLYFNAVAKDWQFEPAQNDGVRVNRIVAVSRNGKRVIVSARRFVIAAGTLESARILLEIQQQASGGLCPQSAAPGCYLADHLSVPIADVALEDTRKVCVSFAPRFEGAWMRNFRFLVKAQGATSPRSFAHFIFEQESNSYRVAKELLGAIQGRRRPSVSMRQGLKSLGGLSLLAYNRFAKSRLYVPNGTAIRMQLDVEQDPVETNKVSLACERDEYGRQRARIDWSVSEKDCYGLMKTAANYLSLWPAGVGGLPRLIPRITLNELTKPYGAYHPVGACRMGDSNDSVVDLNLKVIGSANLWIVSTGVLPSAGTANPTFTMLCLAHDLANKFIAAK